MKKIMLLALMFVLTSCAKDVTSEHVVTSVSQANIIVDGKTLLEFNNPTLYENIKPGDTVSITSSGKINYENEPLFLEDNYLYLTNYQTLGKVKNMTLISRANPLEKDLIFLKEDGNKLIFQDKTSVYSVEPVTPLKVAELPLGATFNVKYFREADTKDYTILSNVYDISLIDNQKKQMIVNVIYANENVLVSNMYDDSLYFIGVNDYNVNVGDRLLISYTTIGNSYDLTNIYPNFKGEIINNVEVIDTIIKANEKTTYQVTFLEKQDNIIKVSYNHETYQLIPENGFEFSNYEFVKGSTLKINANKTIDETNKKITGVYKVRVEA